jgi:Tol biopolymer transport system component
MTDDRDLSVLLAEWLGDGPVRMPDRVSDVVGMRIARQAQRRGWRTVRGRQVRIDPVLAAAAVVALLVVTLVAVAVIGRAPSVVPPRVAPAVGPVAPSGSLTTRRSPLPSPSSPIGPGTVLVEVVDTNFNNELRYIAPDRRLLPVLPGFGGHQRTATWRPDGTGFAFAGGPDGDTSPWMHLYEASSDGSAPHRLTTDCVPPACAEETDPAYSPDGTRLVAVRLADIEGARPSRSVLVIYDLATGHGTEIPNTSFPYATRDIGHPRWSPDGTRIVFHVVKDPPTSRRRLVFPEPTAPGPSSVFVVGVDGSGLRQITPDGLDAGDPDWSPDGSLIVFGPTPWHLWLYGLDQTDWAISTVRPDGAELHVVLADGAAGTPSWTRDGRILFAESYGLDSSIRVIRPDGSNVQRVVTFRSRTIPEYPTQQPTS